MATSFPSLLRDPIMPTNTLLVASAANASPSRLHAAAGRLPADLRPAAVADAARLAPPLSGGEVFTDDRAPVEWLVDTSIVKYAAHGG